MLFLALIWAIWRLRKRIFFQCETFDEVVVLKCADLIWYGGLKLSEENIFHLCGYDSMSRECEDS